MPNWETFKLSELKFDQKNYRTGPQPTQRAALLAIIDDQKQLLANLAKDLLDVGPSPGEPVWVTRERGAYVVIEGNRRLAALKLLETPALADGTIVEEKFRAMAKKFAARPIRELEACVFSSRKEIQPWQRRRHMTAQSGVGLQRWKPMAKALADRDHGEDAPRSLVIVEYLQDDSDEWAAIEQGLDSRWTTVDRVLNTKGLSETLGIRIDTKKNAVTFENGDEGAGKKLLRKILSAMAGPSFDFAQVERVENRNEFLGNFASSAVKAVQGSGRDRAARASTGGKSAATAAATKRAKAATNQATRATLAPKNGPRTFQVDGIRLSSLYKECREISLQQHGNAAALLLRVFIELSSEAYLMEKGVPLPSSASKTGKTKWDDIGIALAMKIASVADHLDPSKRGKNFQQARLALNSGNSPSSVATLHGYFHNQQLQPDAILIRDAWDAWEMYLRELHGAR
jgi:hypothetical protein